MTDLNAKTTDPRHLAEKMLALADLGHPYAEELRDTARRFLAMMDDCLDPDKPEDFRHVLGAWARCRKLYNDCF
jgi:hypothetical protein